MERLTCPITSIEAFNSDTRKVMLKLPDDYTGGFKAGQYLEIVLANGKKCPFSIANSPDSRNTLELHIRPTPDSQDSAVIEALLNSRSELEIEFPKGDCYLDAPPDNCLILLAASTGITQMKSIIECLIPKRVSLPVHLYWGVLADRDLYLSDLCDIWRDSLEDFHFVPVVSEPDSSPGWKGRTGLVGEAVLEDFEDLSDVTVYISGGPAMVYATLDSFVKRGMPENKMFSDVFSYAPRPKKKV